MVRGGARRRHRPVQLDAWNKGQEIELRLKAFPDYWGGWDGAHYTNVGLRVVPQATTAAQLLQVGRGHVRRAPDPAAVATVPGPGRVRHAELASWQTLLALLNTQSGPLADVRVRQALAPASTGAAS